MAPIDDETLDRLLTQHAAAKLDAHLGRAEAVFRERLAAVAQPEPPMRLVQPDPAPSRETVWDRLRRNSRWYVGIAGTAIAASVATLVVLPHVIPLQPQTPQTPHERIAQRPETQSPGVQHPTPVATSEHPVVRYIYNRAWDEGTATDASGQPLRRVRYQQVEQYRYYDSQRKAEIELVVPHEDVEHYRLDTY